MQPMAACGGVEGSLARSPYTFKPGPYSSHGLLLASLVAIVGLFVIPAKRRKAKTELRDKVAALREGLVQTLKDQFEREMERSLQRINEAIAPYTRFVRAEQGKLVETQAELSRIKTGLEDLKVKVDESI